MDIVAQNIANAYTTKDVDGGPYKRRMVTFESVLSGKSNAERAVRIGKVKPDEDPGEVIHQPGHPHAGPDGLVRMPNVKLPVEMVDLMSASRAYEANLSVARNSRSLAVKALTIGK
jgi:flagellar basal-body rod protein FlgC